MNEKRGIGTMEYTPIYAVVDIETTGTDPKEDRLIQFGCVLLQEGKIIGDFSTDINPGKKIPKHITKLTGIHTTQVVKAPYLEEIADVIYSLLEDCVFVAHNIHFDYNFLSEQLEQCGQPPLKNKGIDTVELTQIFFPTMNSFRLHDLANTFQLSHDRPHQADSDAYVTAELLLKIQEKIQQLPLVTIEKIVQIAPVCSMQTSDFIEYNLSVMKRKIEKVNPDVEVVQNIALKKKEMQDFPYSYYEDYSISYPQSEQKKEAMLSKNLTYFSQQGKMMNKIYRFFHQQLSNSSIHNLGIEAPTGMGKTLGYLFPLSYLATPENPVIIATSTIILQQQIMQEIKNKLIPLVPCTINAIEVKSKRHYIDLENFHQTLKETPTQKHLGLYQMAILVWLVETETGDLNELQTLVNEHHFWQTIRYQSHVPKDIKSPFYRVDFWRHLKSKMSQSNFIVVNHSFLCEESHRVHPLLPASHYLVIDEAHMLSQTLQKMGTYHFSIYTLKKRTVEKKTGQIEFLNTILNEHIIELQLIEHLYEKLEQLELMMQQLETDWLDQLLRLKNTDLQEEWISKDVYQYLGTFTKDLAIKILELVHESLSIWELLQSKLELLNNRWTVSENEKMYKWFMSLSFLKEWKNWLSLYFNDWDGNYIKWVRVDEQKNHLSFYLFNKKESKVENTLWYQRYEKILYVSAILKISSNHSVLEDDLQLSESKTYFYQSPFDYKHQAKLLVPHFPSQSNPKEYDLYQAELADFLRKLFLSQEKSILVLFTSHDALQQMYHKTVRVTRQEGRELLAQGISGSKEKILKRFIQHPGSILYGTNSFWEGVDFPNQTLEIIVITRLPFEVPNQALHQALCQNTSASSSKTKHSVFDSYNLPKAIVRIKQGIGRLIRSNTDYGVMIFTDSRLVKTNYGKRILKTLPKDLSVYQGDSEEVLEEIDLFFSKIQINDKKE